MSRLRPVLVLVLAALALTGCRLDVRAEAIVERDGSGTAAIAVTLDEALLAELDELDVDPTAELSAAADAAPAWQVARTVDEDGALRLLVSREVDDPQALTDAFRELTAGLDERDPALAVDLDLEVSEDGAADLVGTVQLRTPIGPGVVTDEATADDLAALAAETVDAALVVQLPGPVTDNDADEVEGSTLTWQVTPGTPRLVTATSAAPGGLPVDQLLWLGAGLAIAVAVAAVVVLIRRRKLSRAG